MTAGPRGGQHPAGAEAADPPRSLGAAAPQSRSTLLAAPVRWPRPAALELPLETLPGVGPRLADAAADAGLLTIGDLLLHVPHAHRDRTIRPLAELEPGERGTVLVQVLGAAPSAVRRRGLSIVSARVGDDSGRARATWFNQPWIAVKLTLGTWLLLTGSRDRRGLRVSEHEILATTTLDSEPPLEPEDRRAAALVPVHAATARLRPQRIRQWMEAAIRSAGDAIEPLPAEMRARQRLAGVADALQAVHFPEREDDAAEGRRRLAFEELFLYQALLLTRRATQRVARPAPRISGAGELVGRWLASLPFAPTGDQRRAFEAIDSDLGCGHPMQRLLMGEVGSGKTVVALYAMLRAVESGYQAVLMAPTETLADQHAATLDRLLAGEPLSFALLTGATPAPRRRRALERLAGGELGLAVGTHALIEPAVRFARLGVVVVDEQHRFGVEQRRALDSKGAEGMAPHVLHMTATPIPRTLALTAYGDLETSTLRELPGGRGPIETRLVAERERPAAYELLRRQLRQGRQAYVVCPLVSESEALAGKAAEREAARLADAELRGFRLGVIHGQMPAARRAAAMEEFAAGATDVLVATTVIEVGIDVPNATVMLIEGAERYGISQLHQLRGRVGRGEHSSHCLLCREAPGANARRRLEAIAREGDGFKLAELDLAMRGEGEAIGTRQHGLPRFRIADLPAETTTLIEAREELMALLRRHGSLDAAALGPLLAAARRRFGSESDPIPL